MEEKVSSSIASAIMNFFKFLGKKGAGLAFKGFGNVVKFGFSKSYRTAKGYEVSSVKKFAKKYPNAGLNHYKADSEEKYKYLKKQLDKCHQPYVVKESKGEFGQPIYNFTTSKANKDLIDYFMDNYGGNIEQLKTENFQEPANPKKSKKRGSLEQREKIARSGMERQERERAANERQHETHKHKEVKKEQKVL
ncbi:MAG: hypothetical protein LUC97_05585 [Clostridiales bacterium]|nr:hypothetical protein [Clostridiales bacterium]